MATYHMLEVKSFLLCVLDNLTGPLPTDVHHVDYLAETMNLDSP